MKPEISLSINPTYYCNFRCSFCYLTEEQLSDKKRIDINKLLDMIDKVAQVRNITHIDLYGGEPFLLPSSYLNTLKRELHNRNIYDIGINSNLSVTNDAIDDDDWWISVSYDFHAREREDDVFNKMLMLNRQFTVLSLASSELIKMDPVEIVSKLNLLSNMSSYEVKPYSSNQANQLEVSNEDYEKFVISLLEIEDMMNFDFTNKNKILEVRQGIANSFSDDHLYITPSGKFAVLEFDENDNEFFLELDSLDDYEKWTILEKERVSKTVCSKCPYYGKCLSEHLRNVESEYESCSGFKQLIAYGEKYEIYKGSE